MSRKLSQTNFTSNEHSSDDEYSDDYTISDDELNDEQDMSAIVEEFMFGDDIPNISNIPVPDDDVDLYDEQSSQHKNTIFKQCADVMYIEKEHIIGTQINELQKITIGHQRELIKFFTNISEWKLAETITSKGNHQIIPSGNIPKQFSGKLQYDVPQSDIIKFRTHFINLVNDGCKLFVIERQCISKEARLLLVFNLGNKNERINLKDKKYIDLISGVKFENSFIIKALQFYWLKEIF